MELGQGIEELRHTDVQNPTVQEENIELQQCMEGLEWHILKHFPRTDVPIIGLHQL